MRARNNPWKRHSLSLAVGGGLLLWIVLYIWSNEKRHLGAFFGNAIADWTGLFVMIVSTKYLHEKSSPQSKPPKGKRPLNPALCWVRDHSLSLFLIATGFMWLVLYLAMDSQSKWGQVVGNIVSEWTQIYCLIVFSKRFIEEGSKESKK